MAAGMVERAGLLVDLHRADDAVELLHRAVAAEPDSQRAWCELARAELSRGRPGDAMKAVDQALRLDPEQEWPHRIASIALGRLGSPAGALEAARKAVTLAPYTWQGHVRLAEALAEHPYAVGPRMSTRDEAWMVACRAVQLAPLEPDPHCTVGHLLLRGHEPQRAEQAFREALRVEPGNARALNGLGLTNLKRGRLLTATSDFGAAVAADPHDGVARRNISAAVWNATRYLIVGLIVDLVIVLRTLGTPALPIGRGVAMSAVLALLVLGTVTWMRVPRRMRGYLQRLPRRDRWLGATLAAVVLTVVLLVAATLVPPGVPAGVLGALALVTCFVTLVLRRGALHRHNREVDRLERRAS